MAKGYRETKGKLKVACAFNDQLFARIARMAKKDDKSFSAMVEDLCKVGILDLEESDALEPKQEERTCT